MTRFHLPRPRSRKATDRTKVRRAGLIRPVVWDAIMVWEMQSGQIRFWNKDSEELHGWDKIDVLGRRD